MTDRIKQPSLLGEISDIAPKKKTASFLGKNTFGLLRPIDINRFNMADFLKQLGDPIESGQLGFSTRVLVQANLPHSEPGKNKPFWERRNGDFSLVIETGYKLNSTGKREPVGIPYGRGLTTTGTKTYATHFNSRCEEGEGHRLQQFQVIKMNSALES